MPTQPCEPWKKRRRGHDTMPTVCTLEKTSQTHHVLQEQPLFWSQSIGFKGVFSYHIMPKDGLKQLDHGVSTDVGLAHFESETLQSKVVAPFQKRLKRPFRCSGTLVFSSSAKIPASKRWLLNLGMLVRKSTASSTVSSAPVRPGMVRNRASVKFLGLSCPKSALF